MTMTLAEFHEMVEAQKRIDKRRRAYLVSYEGGEFTYLIGARNKGTARRILYKRANTQDRKVRLKDISVTPAPDRNFIAQLPEISWPHWYLGYKKNSTGDTFGWFELKDEEE